MMHKRIFIVLITMWYPMNFVYGMDTEITDARHIQLEKEVIAAYQADNIQNAVNLIEGHSPLGNLLLKHVINCEIFETNNFGGQMWLKKINWTKQLLENKLVNVDAPIDNTGNTLLGLAYVSRMKKWDNFHSLENECPIYYMQLLLKHSTNPNIMVSIPNKSPVPLLHYALLHDDEGMILDLLNHSKFDINIQKHAYDLNTLLDRIAILFFIKKIFPENLVFNNPESIMYPRALDALRTFMSKIATSTFVTDDPNDFLQLSSMLNNEYFKMHTTPPLSPHPIETLLSGLSTITSEYKWRIYHIMKILLLSKVIEYGYVESPSQCNPFLPLSKKGCLLEQVIAQRDIELFKLCAQNKNFETLINFPLKGREDGATPLRLCLQYNFPEAIKYIYNACDNKQIEAPDKDGNTPLVYAIKKGYLECVKMLLACHCNPGDDATINVAKTDCPEAVELLKNAQSTTVRDLPFEVLKHVFAHTAQGSSLKKRMTSLVDSAIYVNKAWNSALASQPHLLPDCAATNAGSLDPEHIEKILWQLIKNKDRDPEANQQVFNYLIKQNVKRIKCQVASSVDTLYYLFSAPVCSFLHCALRTYNMQWVKTILYWYKQYDEHATLTNPNHIPLINKPSGLVWTSDTLYASCEEKGITYLGIALHLLKQSQNTEQTVFYLRCIEYMLEHGANPNASVPLYASRGLNPFPLAAVAVMENLPHALPPLIKHGVDVNQAYNFADRGFFHTLLSLAARERSIEILKILLHTDGININALIMDKTTLDWVYDWLQNPLEFRGQTALNSLYNSREYDRNNNYDTIIPLLTNAGAKRAADLTINNNAPAAPPIQNPPVPPIGHLADANQHNALPNNNVAHIVNNNPDPVPGTNPQLEAVTWLGKNPIYWIAGIAACAAGIYTWYRYTHPQAIDQEDNEVTNLETNGPVIEGDMS